MAFLGAGALVNWHDADSAGETDFNVWHSREHLPERVSVPGFRRGRRYRAAGSGSQYLIVYETDSVATLASPAYLARLDDPTPWTRRTANHMVRTGRTACRVSTSLGTGVGLHALLVLLSPVPERAAALRAWLLGEALPALARGTGSTGCHLMEADSDASRVPTKEKEMRGRPDEVADWAALARRPGNCAMMGVSQHRRGGNP